MPYNQYTAIGTAVQEIYNRQSFAPPASVDRSTTLGPRALNGEAFQLSGRTLGGEPARHVGWHNNSTCWNQGSEMCVSVLYARPAVSHAAGWLPKDSYWRSRSEC